MDAVLLIAGKDLRQRLRDRSAVVLGFLAPLVIAALMSMAFRGVDSFHTTLVVADEDHGPVAAAFVDMLHSNDFRDLVTVREAGDAGQARRDVDAGRAGAGVVVPAGFTAAAHGGPRVELTVLASVDRAVDAHVAGAVTQAFSAQLDADRLSVATAVAAGLPAARAAAAAQAATALRLPARVSSATAGGDRMTAIDYYAPAMGIFFMFFAIGFGARSVNDERLGGTLDRIAAAPVPPGVVLAGKALATFVYGAASLTVMALVTSVAFGADWGPWPAVAVLVLALSLVLVTLTALVSAAARTERQAEGLASVLTFGLVLLGGNFVSLAQAPDAIRRLSLATPNGWALRAFTDLATGAPAAGAVLQPVLAILAFALVTGAAAVVLARRAVLR